MRVLAYLLPGGKKVGQEYEAGDLSGKPGKSLKVSLRGKGWSDFATGQSGGDLLDLWAQARCGGDLGEAMRAAGDWLGLPRDDGGDRGERPRRHPRLGVPDHVAEYTDGAGRTLGFVYRWNARGAKPKEIRPLTWCGGKWTWEGFNQPRPLYRQADLTAHPDLRVLVVEGEKKADRAVDLLPGYVVASWPNGKKAVGQVDFTPLRGRRIICWPDADADGGGLEAMEKFARLALAAGAAEACIVALPAGLPDGWDLADPLPEGWTEETIERLIREAPAIEGEAADKHDPIAALGLVLWNRVAGISVTDRQVKGLIGEGSFEVTGGPTGSAKTFLKLDMGFHIATGRPWFGKKTKQAGVLYIAAEGQAGIEKRIAAMKQYYGAQDDVPFALYPAPIDLMTDESGVAKMLSHVEALNAIWKVKVGLIVIDTLARCFGSGDESATRDMSTFVARCDAIRLQARATVGVVHHFGKDETKGLRGSVALKAAADTVIEITGTEGVRTAKVEKQKDGAAGETFGFKLVPVPLGHDEDGELITSCVVEQVIGEPVKATKPAKIPPEYRKALDYLKDVLADRGKPVSSSTIPANVPTVNLDLWRDRLKRRGLHEGGDKGRQWFQRVRNRLIAESLIAMDGELVWLVKR
jgi:hypothetical protein